MKPTTAELTKALRLYLQECPCGMPKPATVEGLWELSDVDLSELCDPCVHALSLLKGGDATCTSETKRSATTDPPAPVKLASNAPHAGASEPRVGVDTATQGVPCQDHRSGFHYGCPACRYTTQVVREMQAPPAKPETREEPHLSGCQRKPCTCPPMAPVTPANALFPAQPPTPAQEARPSEEARLRLLTAQLCDAIDPDGAHSTGHDEACRYCPAIGPFLAALLASEREAHTEELHKVLDTAGVARGAFGHSVGYRIGLLLADREAEREGLERERDANWQKRGEAVDEVGRLRARVEALETENKRLRDAMQLEVNSRDGWRRAAKESLSDIATLQAERRSLLAVRKAAQTLLDARNRPGFDSALRSLDLSVSESFKAVPEEKE